MHVFLHLPLRVVPYNEIKQFLMLPHHFGQGGVRKNEFDLAVIEAACLSLIEVSLNQDLNLRTVKKANSAAPV